MTGKKKKPPKPQLIEDKDLDQASGGLPAVQKVREAAARSSSSANTYTGVTNVNEGVLNAAPDKP